MYILLFLAVCLVLFLVYQSYGIQGLKNLWLRLTFNIAYIKFSVIAWFSKAVPWCVKTAKSVYLAVYALYLALIKR